MSARAPLSGRKGNIALMRCKVCQLPERISLWVRRSGDHASSPQH